MSCELNVYFCCRLLCGGLLNLTYFLKYSCAAADRSCIAPSHNSRNATSFQNTDRCTIISPKTCNFQRGGVWRAAHVSAWDCSFQHQELSTPWTITPTHEIHLKIRKCMDCFNSRLDLEFDMVNLTQRLGLTNHTILNHTYYAICRTWRIS